MDNETNVDDEENKRLYFNFSNQWKEIFSENYGWKNSFDHSKCGFN
jgi:hypothetical protein